MSTRRREAGDIRGALWAARQGLLDVEESETLYLRVAPHAVACGGAVPRLPLGPTGSRPVPEASGPVRGRGSVSCEAPVRGLPRVRSMAGPVSGGFAVVQRLLGAAPHRGLGAGLRPVPPRGRPAPGTAPDRPGPVRGPAPCEAPVRRLSRMSADGRPRA